jgi:chemotaxis protein methyltransferase WspC
LLCLEQARLLADAGRWSESAAICEAYLKAQGASAEAYYLLGRVQDAAGADGQAGEYYRRALYLEPGHCDAMRQWALLAERNGNAAQARILRARAGRRAAA